MSFAEDYKRAKERGKVEQATTQIFQFDEENRTLIGKLKDVTEFKEGKFETEVNKYIFQTDSGLVSTVLGAATDKQITGKVSPGQNLAITWKGKKPIGNGQTVNVFEIEVF
jgi:hypothetical protein